MNFNKHYNLLFYQNSFNNQSPNYVYGNNP